MICMLTHKVGHKHSICSMWYTNKMLIIFLLIFCPDNPLDKRWETELMTVISDILFQQPTLLVSCELDGHILVLWPNGKFIRTEQKCLWFLHKYSVSFCKICWSVNYHISHCRRERLISFVLHVCLCVCVCILAYSLWFSCFS